MLEGKEGRGGMAVQGCALIRSTGDTRWPRGKHQAGAFGLIDLTLGRRGGAGRERRMYREETKRGRGGNYVVDRGTTITFRTFALFIFDSSPLSHRLPGALLALALASQACRLFVLGEWAEGPRRNLGLG